MMCRLVAAAAIVVFAGCGGSSNVGDSVPTDADVPGRAMGDMPDDESGEQIHLLYVLPVDGAIANLT